MTIQRDSVLFGPEMAYPHGGLIDAILDGHAARRPDAPALRYRGEVVSYQRLVANADRAAAALHALGVRPADVVAVRYPPSPAMIAALLGILKCGAAYAAIPMDWPRPRREQLIDKARVRVYLTAETDRDPDVVTVTLDQLAAQTGTAVPPPPRGGTAGDACCVFLTSGSTGEPKSILAPHRGVVRVALAPLLDLGDEPISMTPIAPTGWDGFAFDLWMPLLGGGTVVLYDDVDVSGSGIRRAVADGVNAMFVTASLLHALLDDDPECVRGLRLLVTGGERVSPTHLLACRRRYPHIRVASGYGPAESTIATSLWPVPGPEPIAEVPIGTPVPNTRVYVVDEKYRVVPVGTVGELAISGDGLALGYLGDATETARRFPTITVDGRPVRVYLTGDLVHVDDGGLLWFHGRRDRQIKLRGVRIEPGELERLLERRPDVSHATVLALPLAGPRTERLVAFYTSPGEPPSPEEIVAHVAAAMPAGFRPDRAVCLAAVPRLSNGKVDVHALERLAVAGTAPGEPAAGGAADRAALWRLTDERPGDPDATVRVLLRIGTYVDPAAMRAAVDGIVARDEALRGWFVRRDGRLATDVLPPGQAAGLLMVDAALAPMPPGDTEAEARRWLREPTNLAGRLPARARMIVASTGTHYLAFAVHRIASGGTDASGYARRLAAEAGLPASWELIDA